MGRTLPLSVSSFGSSIFWARCAQGRSTKQKYRNFESINAICLILFCFSFSLASVFCLFFCVLLYTSSHLSGAKKECQTSLHVNASYKSWSNRRLKHHRICFGHSSISPRRSRWLLVNELNVRNEGNQCRENQRICSWHQMNWMEVKDAKCFARHHRTGLIHQSIEQKNNEWTGWGKCTVCLVTSNGLTTREVNACRCNTVTTILMYTLICWSKSRTETWVDTTRSNLQRMSRASITRKQPRKNKIPTQNNNNKYIIIASSKGQTENTNSQCDIVLSENNNSFSKKCTPFHHFSPLHRDISYAKGPKNSFVVFHHVCSASFLCRTCRKSYCCWSRSSPARATMVLVQCKLVTDTNNRNLVVCTGADFLAFCRVHHDMSRVWCRQVLPIPSRAGWMLVVLCVLTLAVLFVL